MAQPSVILLEFVFLGKTYKISCPEESKLKLEKSAELLQNQLEHLDGKGVTKDKQVIMAALFLSYDYLEECNELNAIREELKLLRAEVLEIDRSSGLSISDTKQLLSEIKSP